MTKILNGICIYCKSLGSWSWKKKEICYHCKKVHIEHNIVQRERNFYLSRYSTLCGTIKKIALKCENCHAYFERGNKKGLYTAICPVCDFKIDISTTIIHKNKTIITEKQKISASHFHFIKQNIELKREIQQLKIKVDELYRASKDFLQKFRTPLQQFFRLLSKHLHQENMSLHSIKLALDALIGSLKKNGVEMSQKYKIGEKLSEDFLKNEDYFTQSKTAYNLELDSPSWIYNSNGAEIIVCKPTVSERFPDKKEVDYADSRRKR